MNSSFDPGLPGPGRVEAFSDGVLAIAITLLVLEIHVPQLVVATSAREAWVALVTLAPKLLSYLLSFLFIAVFWVNHHGFFRLIRHVDVALLWLNIMLLLALSFIPFPTAMIGEYPRNPLALALFSVVLMLAGIVFNLMWRHSESHGLFHSGISLAMVGRATVLGLIGPALYGLAAVVAFVFPLATWALLIVVPLIYTFRGHEPVMKQPEQGGIQS